MVCFSCLPGAIYDLLIMIIFIGCLFIVTGLSYVVYKVVQYQRRLRASSDMLLDPQPEDSLLV